jgi:hypothetical protein
LQAWIFHGAGIGRLVFVLESGEALKSRARAANSSDRRRASCPPVFAIADQEQQDLFRPEPLGPGRQTAPEIIIQTTRQRAETSTLQGMIPVLLISVCPLDPDAHMSSWYLGRALDKLLWSVDLRPAAYRSRSSRFFPSLSLSLGAQFSNSPPECRLTSFVQPFHLRLQQASDRAACTRK